MRKLVPILVIILIFFICTSVPSKEYVFKEVEYTVSRGETLWSIAKEYCPDGMDIRDYIHRLHIDSTIYEGQTIIILEEVK